jgi:Flp pilus assembly protein TadD
VPELLLFYLRQSLVPVGLSVTYDFAPQLAPDAGFWLALLPLLAVAGAYACWCARSPRHRRALTVAAAVWLLWLLPVLNLRLLDPAQAIHDRYLYLPLFGLCLAAGVAFRQWSARAPGAEQQAALAVAVVAALLLTAAQVQQMDWSSELLLWSRAARIAPHNDVALSNLGAVLCERGNIPEGMAVFQRELEANPNSWNASYNLGYALYGEHQYAAAEPWVQRALRLRPESAQTLRLMGGIQLRLGRLAAAEHYMRDALSLSPREEDFHTALGLVLLQKGDRAGATHEFMEELRLFPGSQSASRALDQARGESAR